MSEVASTKTEIKIWEEENFPKLATKLRAAEERLQAPLHSLLSRWIVDEKITLNSIHLKLDVSTATVVRLVEYFGFQKEVAANQVAYINSQAIRSFRVKPNRKQQ